MATDIALTVDAIDLLWLHRADQPHFCLITGDQDFTAFVLRLRSQGCNVYCIGKTSKAEALAKVCTHFLPLQDAKRDQALLQKPLQKVETEQAAEPPPDEKTPQAKNTKQPQSQLDPKLIKLLTDTIEKLSAEKQIEWISIPLLGSRLKQLDAQFQAKTYGYKTLPALIESQANFFEHRRQGVHLEVRLKKRTKKEKK
jgi:hypothetical protein